MSYQFKRYRSIFVLLSLIAGALFVYAAPNVAANPASSNRSAVTANDSQEVIPIPLPGEASRAAPPDQIFLGWRFNSTSVCLENHLNQNFPVFSSAVQWNQSDMNFYVRAPGGCAGVALSQKAPYRFYDRADNLCGYSQVGSSSARVTQANAWINVHYPRCYETAVHRAHVVSQIAGHLLGLGPIYSRTDTVMHRTVWHAWPQPLDLQHANGLYPGGQ